MFGILLISDILENTPRAETDFISNRNINNGAILRTCKNPPLDYLAYSYAKEKFTYPEKVQKQVMGS